MLLQEPVGMMINARTRNLAQKLQKLFQRARAQPGQLGQMHFCKKPEWLFD
jgi:hypothetical protein